MKDIVFLAWNYLKYHWAKTLFLLLAISLVIFIPLALDRLAEQGSEKLLRRAVSTPLLLGARGSATELCLSSLYFKSPKLEGIPFIKMKDLEAQELAQAIPLQLEYRVRDQPIVGTTSAYFSFRGLEFCLGKVYGPAGGMCFGVQSRPKAQCDRREFCDFFTCRGL